MSSVTLLGSSSGRNAGDAALMSAIIQSVDGACGTPQAYEIPTIRPDYIRRHYPANARPIGMFPWNGAIKILGIPTYRSMMRTDWSLIFDAILFDRALYNPLFNFMSTLRLFLPHAKRRGRRMAFYNVGVGPVRTAAGRRMLREIAELMDFISVRDQDSLDILRDIGVRHPRTMVGADAALNAPSSPDEVVVPLLAKAGLDPQQPILGININTYIDTWVRKPGESMGKDRFLRVYAAALRRALPSIDAQLAFITTQHHDVPIMRELIARVRPSGRWALLTNIEHSHHEIKGMMRHINLLFAMRLHAMILASSELTPIIGLAYQPKIDHYFGVLGLGERSLSFDDFSEEALARHVIDGWEKRDALRAHLRERIPLLQRKARMPAQVMAGIMRGEDADSACARAQREAAG